jgi:UDP-N-acetylglucosamine 4,6-dehydratase/5-epimerase
MTVIFGGTGTLGKALVNEIYGEEDIHIVSRCCEKQAAMKKEYPDLTFHLGDVTDPATLPYIKKPGAVFNLAAMKHVERGEDNHEYCVAVNYTGVINTYSWAHTHGATSFSQSSTDKAVEPINAYGMAKALAEKYLQSRTPDFPISIFNWGNVLGSRGSVIHKFMHTLKDKELLITDYKMTRFWVLIEDVAAFMWDRRNKPGYHVPNMKSAKVLDIALACAEHMGINPFDLEIQEIGNRGGEKLHEKLNGVTSEDAPKYSREELVEMIEGVFK